MSFLNVHVMLGILKVYFNIIQQHELLLNSNQFFLPYKYIIHSNCTFPALFLSQLFNFQRHLCFHSLNCRMLINFFKYHANSNLLTPVIYMIYVFRLVFIAYLMFHFFIVIYYTHLMSD